MARRVGIALISAVAGYLAGALGGALLVSALSSNRFDAQMEQVMTGAFVTGPIGAVLASVAGFVWSGRRRTPSA